MGSLTNLVTVHDIVFEGGDVHVDCAEDQTVLDAFLRASVWLPNSCNQGTCGTCKISVLSGELDHGATPPTTLSQAERESGAALACQAVPKSDIVIERPNGPSGPAHPLRDLVARVHSIEDVARDTRRVVLTCDQPLEYSAGQHAQLAIPGTDQTRVFSFANESQPSTELEFHVRREPGGVASDKWVFGRAFVGELLQVRAPFGTFVWDHEDQGPVVMIAGGTGLAPLLCMLREALPTSPARQVTLYFGARHRDQLYDTDVLDALQKRYESFTWVSCADDDSASSGTVIDRFLADHPSCRGYSGYLCGPPPMVDAGVQAFKRRRMAPRRIFREQFLPHVSQPLS